MKIGTSGGKSRPPPVTPNVIRVRVLEVIKRLCKKLCHVVGSIGGDWALGGWGRVVVCFLWRVMGLMQPVRLAGADGWCCFLLREEYCWLVAGGWFVLREKYCWLVADKPSEQGDGR
jgi:hypothetical protein